MRDPVLVLGATGFLGAASCRALLASGRTVVAPVREGRSLPPDLAGRVATLAVLEGDDSQAYVRALRALRPAAVVDAAWEGVMSRDRAHAQVQERNVARTHTLLHGLDLSAAQAWVGLGSQAEYGHIDGLVDEQHPLRPKTAYGRAKLEVADLLDRTLPDEGVRPVWLRVFASYGPGQEPGWLVRDALTRLLRGEPVPLTTGRQGCDYLYVDDVAAAIIALLEAPHARGSYNVGSGAAVDVADLIATAKRICDSPSPLLLGALPDPPGPVTSWAANTARLRADTEWQPRTSLQDGLRATVAWLRDHHEAAAR